MPDITVNPASKLTATQLVAMIRQSPHVPAEVKLDLKAQTNMILGPAKIQHAGRVAPNNWKDDFAAAFVAKHWELTTAQQNFEVIKVGAKFRVHRTITLNLQSGEFGPAIKLLTGFSPDNRDLNTQFDLDNIEFLWGGTYSSAQVDKHLKSGEASSIVRLKSQRALVFLINSITVVGVNSLDTSVAGSFPIVSHFMPSIRFPSLSEFVVTSRVFSVPEVKLVATFLHEVAAHAGRMSQGRTSHHGDGIVEDNVSEIESPFSTDASLKNSVRNAIDEAEGRLRDLSLKASAKGRAPGPVQGSSSQGRTPGPVR